MTAQQAAAGDGFGRSHKKRARGGCGFSKRDRDGQKCDGVIRRTTQGISEAFGIPRKGVLVAFILILIFSFPVGVMLFGLAWAYVHHPHWFDGLRGKIRGGSARRSAPSSASGSKAKSDASDERPTVGVDYEESWMEDLRDQFDDLERRTGSMEGFVASGDYGVASELAKMKQDDVSNAKNAKGAKNDPDQTGNNPDGPKA
ncbi:hypothetical protein ACQ0MK_19240 [Thalassospira lucentensis]|uniref:hypothetical protein n=1 Tax=Thalassospira lucentensis TaxID=168935 RepID=UPI003D2EBD18